MIIAPVKEVLKLNQSKVKKRYNYPIVNDYLAFENVNVNKKALLDRHIIKEDENINAFFDKVSSQIYEDKNSKEELKNSLKNGYISLSSSMYQNIKSPTSATRVDLNKNENINTHLFQIMEKVSMGNGIGINFSNLDNPIDEIKEINSFFKSKENKFKRKPALIGLLNVDNPHILDFITLKDNEEYRDWCFDLSVVLSDDFFEKLDKNEDIILSNNEKISSQLIYNTLISSIDKKAEPGIIFSNKKDYACDCCGCVELNQNESLSLGQINLSKFQKNNQFDYDKLKKETMILKKALNKIDKESFISVLGYQDLLNQLNIKYGSSEALLLLKNILKTIKSQDVKIALSPTGTISRLLKTSPSIESDEIQDIDSQLNTLKTAQNEIDGQISNTIKLKKDANFNDIDYVIKKAKEYNLKGITIFKAQ